MKPLYVIATGIVVVALMLSVQILNSSTEDYSTYNTQWSGSSRLHDLSTSSQGRPVFSAFSLRGLDEMDRGMLIVLNPSGGVGMTQTDIANIQSFVQHGGSLLLSADFGDANSLLDGLGLSDLVRFNQSLLIDEMSNWGGSQFPQISTVASSAVTSGVHQIAFNYGTTLDINGTSQPANAQVLATSGPSSYLSFAPKGLETPQNGTKSQKGEWPVLMFFEYGKGKIILLSDPSVFANGMLDKGDNAKLYKNIVANLTDDDASAPIIFDESHRVQQPVLAVAYSEMMLSDTQKYVFVLGATSLFVIGVVVSTRRKKTAPQRADEPFNAPLDEATILGFIAARHPRWRQSLLKELLSSVRLSRRQRRL